MCLSGSSSWPSAISEVVAEQQLGITPVTRLSSSDSPGDGVLVLTRGDSSMSELLNRHTAIALAAALPAATLPAAANYHAGGGTNLDAELLELGVQLDRICA
jgi:hypothetical protein